MFNKPPFLVSEDGYEISRTEFRRMRQAAKREAMIQWFHSKFEDPAHRTPYESAEGGYIWIWGGPYDALEELGDKFGALVSEGLLEEVVEEIELEGSEWAPVPSPEDYDDERPEEPPYLDVFLDEASPGYGTPEDYEARNKAITALGELDAALNRPSPIGIGHNHPPSEIEQDEDAEVLRTATKELRLEFSKASPNIALVKRWANPLRDALLKIGGWTAKKLDKMIDGAVEEFGKTVGKAAGITFGGALGIWGVSHAFPSLCNSFNAIIHWLHIVAQTAF